MNWLAHVFLSQRPIECQLGNLLADIVRGQQREELGPLFVRGVRHHQAIDAFTDAHAIVRASRRRINERQRRFSGVLVDIFYDYCLAAAWDQYCDTDLDSFTAEFYSSARSSSLQLPADAQLAVDRIIQYDLLGAYRSIAGLETSIYRLSQRLSKKWGKQFELEKSVADLREQEKNFTQDFAEFFPQLQAHVRALTN